MNLKTKYIFFLLFISLTIYTVYNIKNNFIFNIIYYIKNQIIPIKKQKTLFGELKVYDTIISDALINNALLRMKHIDQAGPLKYFNLAVPFSRYDHCIGVWALIKNFNGNIKEQLAGLFHDISHTAFSHVADNIFQNDYSSNEQHSYQDNIHLWYIKNSPAYYICEKYNIDINELNPDIDIYTMLERPLPEMCADRIEYNLHTAYLCNMLSKEDIEKIISHLHFEKTWYFDDIISAKKFAMLPLHFTKTIWNAAYNMVFYKFFAHLISYAFSKKYITKDLFHFGTDQEILNILYKNNDPYIVHMIKTLNNIFNTFEIINNNDNFDELLKGKFRGIDPLIKQNNEFKKLSEIDFEFNYFYNLTKKECENGYKIKYKVIFNSLDFYANQFN